MPNVTFYSAGPHSREPMIIEVGDFTSSLMASFLLRPEYIDEEKNLNLIAALDLADWIQRETSEPVRKAIADRLNERMA